MAGSKIEMPANGSTDWSDFVNSVEHSWRAFQFISLTNQYAAAASAIQNGSYAVLSGSMYMLSPSTGGNESISTTGLSTGFTEGELWIKGVPSTADTITAELTTDPPTWRSVKGGYYGPTTGTADDKYYGGVYYSTNGYEEKWLYHPGQKSEDNNPRPILEKEVAVGAWDMDADGNTQVNLIYATTRILRISGIIFSDSTSDPVKGYLIPDADISFRLGSSFVTIARAAGSIYDSTNFDDTSINRMNVLISYRG